MKKNKLFLLLTILLLVIISLFQVDSTPATPIPEEISEEITITEQPEETVLATETSPQPEEVVVEKKEVVSADEVSETGFFCTLTVRCDDVLENFDKLSEEKHKIIPENGLFFPKQKLAFSEGDSVFDILKTALTERKIHLEFVYTPIYDSVYIEGIGNLYEFDCGDTSGWTYTVNGVMPTHGSSQHPVRNGDNIVFLYKCSLY